VRVTPVCSRACSHAALWSTDETVKTVRVRDARLGVLRLVMLMTIIGYILVYNIIWQ
jgi:hypothetical protein